MTVSKVLADRIVTGLATVAAPVLTLLVDTHTLGAQTATDLGGIVAAAVVAWHGGSIAQDRLAGRSAIQDPVPAVDDLGQV